MSETFDPVRAATTAGLRRTGGVAVASITVNLLMLNGSIYMMQVYDRVLVARSVPTLVTLTGLMVGLYLVQGALDALRQRLMVRIAAAFAAALRPLAHAAALRLAASGSMRAASLPEQDVERVRTFLAGSGPSVLIDLPFAPVFLALVFAIHPALGCLALGGAVVLMALPWMSGRLTRRATAAAARVGARRAAEAEAQRRHAESARVLGSIGALRRRSLELAATTAEAERGVADVVGAFGVASRTARLALQSALLGLGAWLLIHDAVSSGAILATSVLVGRALAPVDLAISQWRGFAEAREAWRRLRQGLAVAAPVHTRLPAPSARLAVEGLTVVPPGAAAPAVSGLDFALEAGDVLGVIGPSGAGKSSLARALVGLWTPAAGAVRLDGARLDQWDPEDLGRHVGWVPQSVGFVEATIAETIGRLDADAPSEAVIAAARAAGIHEMILRTPEGYDTRIGDTTGPFSTGQRQRLALARALYGAPFLIVLDEANSNLDGAGEVALARAVGEARERGAIVVMITHRPALLAACTRVLVLEDGAARAFGPRDEVLRSLERPVRVAPRAA